MKNSFNCFFFACYFGIFSGLSGFVSKIKKKFVLAEANFLSYSECMKVFKFKKYIFKYHLC